MHKNFCSAGKHLSVLQFQSTVKHFLSPYSVAVGINLSLAHVPCCSFFLIEFEFTIVFRDQ